MKHNLLLGVTLALISTLFYSALTAVIKVVANDITVPVLVFIQSGLALIMFLPFLLRKGTLQAKSTLSTSKIHLHILRSILSLSVSYALFSAVQYIPLVNAMLLANTTPLIIPFIAYFFLAQKINHHFWLPMIIGLIGITLVLQPDGHIFHPAALLALFSALAMAAAVVTVRKLAATDSPETITFYYFLLSTVISGIIAYWYWTPVSLSLWVLLGMGTLFFLSQYLYTCALAFANVQLIGSLLYANIVNSAIFSAVIWHAFPSALTLAGIVLTVAGGILCIRVEHQYHKREATLANELAA